MTQPGIVGRQMERTRSEIAAAAIELFAARGFSGTSVQEVADRAGVSHRTVYRYFPRKEDLLGSFLAGGGEALATAIRRHLDALPFIDAVAAGFLDSANEAGLDSTHYRDLTRITMSTAELRLPWLASVRDAQDSVQRLVVSVSGLSEMEARVVSGAIIAALNTALETWAAGSGELDRIVARCLAVVAPLLRLDRD